MTGRELYELLQVHSPAHFWAIWDVLPAASKGAYDAVALELTERHDDAVFEATAGEDI